MTPEENARRSTAVSAQRATMPVALDVPFPRERLDRALRIVSDALWAELAPNGHWVGELASSALSTATAVIALAQIDCSRNDDLIAGGLRWLATHVNEDGGWGDTVRSKSNLSTSALAWAAFGHSRADAQFPEVVSAARAWLARNVGNHDGVLDAVAGGRVPDGDERRLLPPATLVSAIERRYGDDRTFSIPIVMTLALSGRLGSDGWRHVRPLPFELAALPGQLFGALGLPVVSYALPALIAIGQVIHHHAPPPNRLIRSIRNLTRNRTLRLLTSIQPCNGGFLEATPLTSFVTMSLAAMGRADHVVARRGAEFLHHAVRADGSWPIDSNLATWVTTLAIGALAPQLSRSSAEARARILQWLLVQQHRVPHPYTRARAGGWAWTDLPGGVPDADDTAGALLALLALGPPDTETRVAGNAGIRWLLDLQNRDGGIPTFCRGWGTLAFDQSSADLTGHALRAWSAWLPLLPSSIRHQTLSAIHRGLRFLTRTQRSDGSWRALWFGNEHAPQEHNLTYGTAKVLLALRALKERGFFVAPRLHDSAARWLVAAQREEGSWSGAPGGPASVEETALALEALAGLSPASVNAGTRWLVERVDSGTWCEPAPIGFYFARLWYYERLYPMIFTLGALGKVAAL